MRYAMLVKAMQVTAPAVPSRRPLVPPQYRVGLSRTESAQYIGVGVSLFDEMVADGRMPPPKQINSRKVWPRTRFDEAFAELPDASQDEECGGATETADPWTDCA